MSVAPEAALSLLFLRREEVVVVNVSEIAARKKAVAHQFRGIS